MRQACPSAGIDPDGDIVGIPEIYFDLPKATRKHLPSLRGRFFSFGFASHLFSKLFEFFGDMMRPFRNHPTLEAVLRFELV